MSLRSIRFQLTALLFLIASMPVAMSQNDSDLWRDMLEQWAEQNDSETVPDDLLEQLQSYRESPINLNDTLSTGLFDLPFISDLQRDIIRSYIKQNGQMVSFAELYLMNGFDTLTLSLLRPFVTVVPIQQKQLPTIRDIFRDGRGNLRFGTKVAFPRGRGYTENIYEGSPFRMYFRYNYHYYDRVYFQISGDKDPGESFLHQSPIPGFDYYGYYLMFKDFSFVKRAIVGKYNLQFGQGATLWTGFAPWMSGSMPLWRYGQGIRPSSAFCEYGYLRGAATTLALSKQLELSLFYSDVDRDATVSLDSIDDENEVMQSLYNSGYHRTATEIAKEGQLSEKLFGTHLQYGGCNFTIGATAYRTLYENALVPSEKVYNEFTFRGKDNFNAGIDGTFRYRRMLLFAELAVAMNDTISAIVHNTSWLPVASVAGMQFHIDANTNLSLAYRYGSPIYQNLYSNTIGQSSLAQNEEGVTIYFQSRLPFYISLVSSVDFFRYPWMRYRVYAPSSGVDYRLKLSKDIAPHLRLDCQYRYRQAERNSDIGENYSIENIVRQQFYVSLDYSPDERWRLLSRLFCTRFSCDDHVSQNGFMLMQEVSYRAARLKHPLSVALRLAIFDISGYDARIYAYESDLLYEFSVPMFTGRGIRSYLVYRHELNSRFSIAFKYGVSFFPENQTIGSAYETINANNRHEFKFQCRLFL